MNHAAIQTHRASGYNTPVHEAMFVSQWLHQMFIWGVITYEKYIELQNAAYAVLPPSGPKRKRLRAAAPPRRLSGPVT